MRACRKRSAPRSVTPKRVHNVLFRTRKNGIPPVLKSVAAECVKPRRLAANAFTPDAPEKTREHDEKDSSTALARPTKTGHSEVGGFTTFRSLGGEPVPLAPSHESLNVH